MSFGNEIVAGEELVRSGIRSKDYVSGSDGWRIVRDGSAEFNSLSVRGTLDAGEIIYQGQPLSDFIDALPRGVVAYGNLAAQTFTGTTGGAMKPLLEVAFTAEPNRSYRIYTENSRGATDITDTNVVMTLRMTTDGSQPTTSNGTELEVAERSNNLAGRYGSLTLSTMYLNGGSSLTCRVLLSFGAFFSSSTATMDFDDIKLIVEDVGVAPFNNGINRYAGSTPIKTFHTFEINPTASRSYTGAGNLVNGDATSTRMYQGDIGVDGNRRSWMWFSQTEISDLVGVPLGDIDYCDVFLNYDHWYYTTGSIAKLGYHNSTTVSSTEPGGGVPSVASYSWPGRDIGQWVSVKGVSSIMTAINGGTFKGFMLGNTGSSDLHQYGYAWGASAAAGLRPAFRCGYWKV